MDAAGRVLVVEDEVGVRAAVALALRQFGYDVAEAGDGAEALSRAAAMRPQLAILDVRLPGDLDGFGLARWLRASGDPGLLFLTAADDRETLAAGYAAGADDFVTKPFDMAELLLRLAALARRCGVAVEDRWEVGDLVVDEGAATVTAGGAGVAVTATELRLLCVLARHRGRVLSKAALLRLAWGSQFYDENVVERHVCSLRRKLEAHGLRPLQTVKGIGYVLRAADRGPHQAP